MLLRPATTAADVAMPWGDGGGRTCLAERRSSGCRRGAACATAVQRSRHAGRTALCLAAPLCTAICCLLIVYCLCVRSFYFGESGVAGRPGCGPLLLTGGAALAGHRVRGQPARAALHALPRTRWGCLPARASGRRRPAAVSLAPAALTRGALLFVNCNNCLTGQYRVWKHTR